MRWKEFLYEHRYLFFFLIVAILIRAPGLDIGLFSDEAGWAVDIATKTVEGMKHVPHPPTMLFLFQSMYKITDSYTAFRLVPLLISLINITLVYMIARRVYSKKAAILALFIYVMSYWATQAALQVDMDGSLLTMWYLLVMYLYIIYMSQNKFSDQVLMMLFIGIALGCTLLTKYTGVLLFAILVLHHLVTKRSITKTILFMFPTTIVAGVVFSIFPIWSWIVGNNFFAETVGHGGGVYYLTLIRPITYLFLWATPVLTYFLLLGILPQPSQNKQSYLDALSRKHSYFIVWFLVVFLFYTFVISGSAPSFDRYFMPMVPAMIILAAQYLANFKFTKRVQILGIGVYAATTALFFFLNTKTQTVLLHNIGDYIHRAMTMQWEFLFPYTGSSGPFFWIAFSVMGTAIAACSILLLIALYQTWTKSKYLQLTIMLILAIGLAFNSILITEYAYTVTQPSHGALTQQTVDYIFANNLQDKRMYTSVYQQQVMFYTNHIFPDQITQYITDTREKSYFDEHLLGQDAIAVIIDMPMTLNKKGEMWAALNQECERTDFSDKGRIAAYVFYCPQ